LTEPHAVSAKASTSTIARMDIIIACPGSNGDASRRGAAAASAPRRGGWQV
jgi:hypothetical protein